MLNSLGCESMEQLISETIPADIRLKQDMDLESGKSESALLAELKQIASKNKVMKSYIGTGYYGTVTPPVILRNVLENPQWYTAYTPYQAEISQGRMESLLNFQTMVIDLTGLPFANASLLDEATAAAEAMALCLSAKKRKKTRFFVSSDCHPQTIALCQTRADGLKIELEVGDAGAADLSSGEYCGVLLQYPATEGQIKDYGSFVDHAHDNGALVVVATDLLALTVLKPPGEFGADVAVGSTQVRKTPSWPRRWANFSFF